MKYNTQVNADHYLFSKYVKSDRWMSYYHQIDSIQHVSKLLEKDKLSILEIGMGDGTVSTLLKKLGHNVITVDIDENLKPDFVSSLPELKLKKMRIKYDCVACFEVLEHLKFSDLEKSFKRIKQIANIIAMSIPHKGLTLSVSLKFWLYKAKIFYLSLPLYRFINHRFNGEHYWELGTKEVSMINFRDITRKSGWEILKDFRIPENPYHHFFILRVEK